MTSSSSIETSILVLLTHIIIIINAEAPNARPRAGTEAAANNTTNTTLSSHFRTFDRGVFSLLYEAACALFLLLRLLALKGHMLQFLKHWG